MNNVTIGPIIKEDYSILFDWINKLDLVVLSNNYQPIHETSHEQWFNSIVKRDDVRIFAIRLDGALVGTCQLYNIDWLNRNAELQIRISTPEKRGLGVGKVAVSELVNYAFKHLGMNKVYLHVFDFNTNAIAFYRKRGFVQDGVLRDHEFINGVFCDVIVMSILKKEYTNDQ